MPAAIPGQQGAGPPPSRTGVGSGNGGGFSSPLPNRPLSRTGDQISIPIAARGEPAWPNPPGPTQYPSAEGNSGSAPFPTKTGKLASVAESSSPGSSPSGTASPANPTQPLRPYLDPGSPSSLEGKERIVREIERTASAPAMAPRYAPYSGAASSDNSSVPAASDKGINIADLPESK